ncbi:hypothetical protein [uncultured Propionivibrio sp.]|uniref:hypothetical protein n=1 Tax=uncultured Propionivibrio sp. TaxID=426737 RepID=UPI0029C0F194|nr:hypothetical protein [uncultured Propionivibrio sp.]
MRWYMNDLSLQGQFPRPSDFFPLLNELLSLRNRYAVLRSSLYVTRSFPNREVTPQCSLNVVLREREFRDLRGAVLNWFDRTGPFVEDDRQAEIDDYFEYLDQDVTDTGLGEAARRIKTATPAMTVSFQGGQFDFSQTPLFIDHGLKEDRLGAYGIENIWTSDDLAQSARGERAEPRNWQELVEVARERFEKLTFPDAIYTNSRLAREPFDTPIRDRALALWSILNDYMRSRNPDGSEGAISQSIIDLHFTGDRAAFTGESTTNQRDFKSELTFPDPGDSDATIFGHWHGKISHRFFRMHFEWPARANSQKLKILYLGPKLTKG